MLSKFIRQVPLVGFFDILGEVTKESKRWCLGRKLGDVFDFYIMASYCWRWIVFDFLSYDLVQFGGRDTSGAIVKYI